MTSDIVARGLVVHRPGFTLGPLDLDIEAGEYLVLVGPSGAGKTMLVETLLGWHAPAAGEALVEGVPVTALAPAARRVAYLPQDLGILPHLSVMANLTWGLACRGARPDRHLLERVVEVLHLGRHLERRDPTTLSRGEQQRVALGRALLTRPRRLVLDEPCAAIDPHRRRELQLLLRALHSEFGTTVVHVTHDREEAFLLGQRIGVVLAGRLHQVATPAELYARPADLEVARFVAPENLWPCAAVDRGEGGARVRLAAGSVELDVEADGPPVAARDGLFVGIRPEEVMVLNPERPLRPQVARNVLVGRIEELLLLDGRAQARIATAAGLEVVSRLSFCAVQDLGLAPGARMLLPLRSGPPIRHGEGARRRSCGGCGKVEGGVVGASFPQLHSRAGGRRGGPGDRDTGGREEVDSEASGSPCAQHPERRDLSAGGGATARLDRCRDRAVEGEVHVGCGERAALQAQGRGGSEG